MAPDRERPTAIRAATDVVERSDSALRLLSAMAVIRDGRVLVMREEDEPFHKAWVLPQGFPHPGETVADAAAREVEEELGLRVPSAGLLGVYDEFERTSAATTTHWVIVCYRTTVPNGAEARPSREAVDFAWVLPTARLPRAPSTVERILRDLAVSDHRRR